MWTRLLGLLVVLAAGPAVAGDVDVRLRALSRQAVAGIPVVVELQVVNVTSNEVQTFELTDPSIARIFWTWRTASGRSYDVRMRDYRFSVIPEPMFPRKVTIPPHGQITRLHTVPTPTDFPGGEVWTLAVRIRDPIDQTVATAEVTYEGGVLPEPPVAGKIDPGLAQAALLEYSRSDVLDHAFDARSLQAVEQATDPVARLIVVSKRMKTGEDTSREWEALDRASMEAGIVRNYLLLDDVRRTAARKRRVSARRIRLAKRVRANQPLYREIRTALRLARRGPTPPPSE